VVSFAVIGPFSYVSTGGYMGSETENGRVWNSGTGAFFIVMGAFD
jgi:hypothetical protein